MANRRPAGVLASATHVFDLRISVLLFLFRASSSAASLLIAIHIAIPARLLRKLVMLPALGNARAATPEFPLASVSADKRWALMITVRPSPTGEG